MVAATEVVEMDDSLEIALRKKKDSSMRVCIEQVREGKAAAAMALRQWSSVFFGVRKLLVQLTTVEPPTVRPCTTVSAPSLVGIAPPSR